ncbi:MAG: hypothetical protein WBQ94_08270 [Terracidiphilus sp.]
MAASTTTSGLVPAETGIVCAFAPGISGSRVCSSPRRRITPQAGRALEILGHAIEYLTDEFVHEGGALSGDDDHIKAVQLLMALNRQVYYECPEVPSFAERCRSFLGLTWRDVPRKLYHPYR